MPQGKLLSNFMTKGVGLCYKKFKIIFTAILATQMDGWLGNNVKFRPDQMQILNPIMILLFLPLFQDWS